MTTVKVYKDSYTHRLFTEVGNDIFTTDTIPFSMNSLTWLINPSTHCQNSYYVPAISETQLLEKFLADRSGLIVPPRIKEKFANYVSEKVWLLLENDVDLTPDQVAEVLNAD